MVTLNGSNSSDPDNGIASYLWTQTAGPSVTMSGSTTGRPTFTSPNVGSGGTSLAFQLTVADNGGLKSTDICIINVSWVNQPPTANAGPNQTVEEGLPPDWMAPTPWILTMGSSVISGVKSSAHR